MVAVGGPRHLLNKAAAWCIAQKHSLGRVSTYEHCKRFISNPKGLLDPAFFDESPGHHAAPRTPKRTQRHPAAHTYLPANRLGVRKGVGTQPHPLCGVEVVGVVPPFGNASPLPATAGAQTTDPSGPYRKIENSSTFAAGTRHMGYQRERPIHLEMTPLPLSTGAHRGARAAEWDFTNWCHASGYDASDQDARRHV